MRIEFDVSTAAIIIAVAIISTMTSLIQDILVFFNCFFESLIKE
jgi:hypothetical protein